MVGAFCVALLSPDRDTDIALPPELCPYLCKGYWTFLFKHQILALSHSALGTLSLQALCHSLEKYSDSQW